MDLSKFSMATISGGMTFTGVTVVFLALVGLSLVVWLFGKFFVSIENRAKTPKVEAPAPQAPAPVAPKAPPAPMKPAMVVEDGIGDEIVAVIAAAVAAMSGESGGYALRSVRRAKEARPAWATAGLQQNTQPF